MSIEEQIIKWSKSRPPWQQVILGKLGKGDVLTNTDYEELLDSIVGSGQLDVVDLALDHLPQADPAGPTVSLVSIAGLEHVNALASERPLAFEPTGFTVIYGDNASGKSGYARVLERIARARHQDEVLSDVFRDATGAKPKATLTVRIGDTEAPIAWPAVAREELQRMLFYNKACGDAYVAAECDFPYRPSALFVMDGLIQACIAIRSRLDSMLEENAGIAATLPSVDEDLNGSEIGRYLQRLSGVSSIECLDALIEKLDVSTKTIEELKDQEARLRIADTTKERQRLTREATELDAVAAHLRSLEATLGDGAVTVLAEEYGRLETLQAASDLLATAFESEPLPGVGTSPWKELWESARRFSSVQVYPNEPYPVVATAARCVLCQQPLDEQARDRLSRFERFVEDDTQTRLRDTEASWNARVEGVRSIQTTPEPIETNLSELEADHADLVRETQALLADYDRERTGLVQAIAAGEKPRLSGLAPQGTMARLVDAGAALKAAAEGLANPEAVRQQLAAITIRRKELELIREVKRQRALIAGEITRRKQRDLLETVKSAAATGPITKKILELSEDNITEVVRDTFTRETQRLQLERVTITKTRADKGALLHQPKLVGTRQTVPLPRVLSEGERTALGLAAFFTEATLDASRSALILDDPVCSLDHIRRGLVAARLAALAATRQVVVFTHDVSFVAELKREARGLGVSVGERSVTRGRGAEKRPGACTAAHPWKAKDVAERLGELRNELVRIRKDREQWDGVTYENEVATWAGNISETWERIFSQELVGPILAEGGLEVRPNMVKVLSRFSDEDERQFQASYGRVSQWAKRHDKSGMVNYVAPEISILEEELARVDQWFKRVKGYKA